MTRRDAAEIGAGLEPARPAAPILRGARIHVVGAGGAAAAAAALHAHHVGATVSGCDPGGPSQYTPPVLAEGIPLAWEHDTGHIRQRATVLVDRLAVTKALTAIRPDHPELVAAREAGISATSVQQLIADAAATRGQALIGLAGTHGKSTTTGWVVHLLATAGLDPSAFVGALMPASLAGGTLPSTVRLGEGRYFVVEADEYAGNFDPFRAAVGAVINAEWDHPDVFADRAEVVATLATWARRFDRGGELPALVVNVGDPGGREVAAALADWDGRLVVTAVVDAAADPGERLTALDESFGARAGGARSVVARWLPGPAGEGSLEIHGLEPGGGSPLLARIGLAGRHNADNGLVAAVVAHVAGAGTAAIAAGLASYPGVGRRLELKGDVGGVVVLDDYGHHPTAIAATLAAVALRYPGRRRWAVYEPLTYHRTAAMLDAFAEVLGEADRVAIAEIHAGRDPDTTIISAAALAGAVARRTGTPAAAPGTVEETADWLATQVEAGDVVLVMGGGRSYVVAERLVARLRERSEA